MGRYGYTLVKIGVAIMVGVFTLTVMGTLGGNVWPVVTVAAFLFGLALALLGAPFVLFSVFFGRGPKK